MPAFAAPPETLPRAPVALAMSRDRTVLYAAESGSRQVARLDPRTGRLLKAWPLPVEPSALALAPDGQRLYVAGGGAEGWVLGLDTETGAVRDRIRAGHTPSAMVLTPDGSRLFVCNRFNHDVSAIALRSNRETARIPVRREPAAIAITPDGATLFVANLLPECSATAEQVAASVTVIRVSDSMAIAHIPLPNGSTCVRGLCVSPDGRHVFVAHILGRFRMPTTQVERGWMNTNVLTILDVLARTRLGTVLLDELDRGAANPWGVACSDDGRFLGVTHAGTRELSVIDAPALIGKLAQPASSWTSGGGEERPLSPDVSDNLTFLSGIRQRIPLPGVGPRALLIAGHSAWIADYFSDTVSAVALESKPPQVVRYALGASSPMNSVRRGEMLFNDATSCFQQWQSCESCHPDARVDGLNWDLLNDGVGNPRNTKNMLLAHATPPAMITGVRSNAETAVRAGMKFIKFSAASPEDAEAIDAYLKALKPIPSPFLENGRLSRSARRGRKLFGEAGCARCHPPPLFTDMKAHDVGTASGPDAGRPFDTPTLIESWRTAPYLNDGRAATLRDVLTRDNPGDRHGRTSRLSPLELADLIEFIQSQ